MNEPYERILELARREAELVSAGQLEELAALWAERDTLVSALGETPPPAAAREPLLEAERIVRSTRTRITALLQELGEQMGQLSTGRRAVSGYGGAATPPRALDARG